MASSHSLPQDIITEILSWLPVKSIIRFDGLSKSWSSIFQTPLFIEKHLRCSTQNSHSLFLQRWDDESHGIFYNPHKIIFLSKTIGPQFERPFNFDIIIGVSNGLVCCSSAVYDIYGSLFLWNPATRKCRRIPQPKFRVGLTDFCFGFCFNSNDNDYKIVQLDAFGSVEMFSLRSGSWKEIGLSNCECECSSNNLSVNVSGCMFWIVKRNEESCILSFDTGSEEYEIFTVPSYNESAKMKLELYENSLALLVDSVIGPSYSVDLWVLDVQQRSGKFCLTEKSNPKPLCSGFLGNHWKKIHTVELASISQYPIGIWQNELLFQEGQFIYGHGGFKVRVPSSGHSSPRSFFFVFTYEESLVSLDGGGVDEMLMQAYFDDFLESLASLFQEE
ncbi:hypothetical protein L6164_037269 [Bauhinia variegata]|uniref:Uncharacterized protein n=1 Tax=Bauhinia variegata TaxID=167791 RepID=A0ACB9KJN1_BAUVA|nr:hypothetical protein L6164_037269 [Bauhinia variegata]